MKIVPPNITPGPWRFANGRVSSRSHQKATDTRLDVICDLDMDNDPHGEQGANARAIAATPDALAALAELLRAYENKHGVTISGNTELALAVFAARAALIKAGYTIEE